MDLFKTVDGVYQGSRPNNTKDLSQLDRAGIRTIISLDDRQNLLEERYCAANRVMLIIYPIDPTTTPRDEQISAVVNLLHSSNKPVLLHCYFGKDRTNLFMAAYLVSIGAMTLPQARAWMKSHGFPYGLNSFQANAWLVKLSNYLGA